ncbi:MAG: hypothetical protein GYA42_04355 [Syntrophomonadaceae bacterium]|nr:hypothetical protein [Syntrophomonadaceae bacterium]
MTNKAKMIFLNLILLAGITFSMKTAFADLPANEEGSTSRDQEQITDQSQGAALNGERSSGTGPDGSENCSLMPVDDGCTVCAGCSSPCSLIQQPTPSAPPTR